MQVMYWTSAPDDPDAQGGRPRKFPFVQDGECGVEWTVVKEWYPIFLAHGMSPRLEILKWWRAAYPERAAKERLYKSICKNISWWDHHTDFSHSFLREENMRTHFVTVKPLAR